jgi:dTDP-4-dehydrorhamnose reductase
MIGDICPDVVVNCAAYTDVDRAEEEREKAFLINGEGVKNLAQVCRESDIDLCHISTDYVFDGTKKGPYTPDDLPNPINVYGQSKLAGEKHILDMADKFYIIRSSWLYGKYGNNFVFKMLKLAEKQKELRVVDDQIGSPTWTGTLARVIAELIRKKRYGLYHVTDETEGGISWCEFAKEIVRLFGLKPSVIPVKTGEFPVLAKRPRYSVLDLAGTKDILKENLPNWEDSLKKLMQLLHNIPRL